MIEVRRLTEGDPLEFEVAVHEGSGDTHHHATMSRSGDRHIAGKHSPERCIEAAFPFLLDREPSSSFSGTFRRDGDPGYFPEFERELPDYLSRS